MKVPRGPERLASLRGFYAATPYPNTLFNQKVEMRAVKIAVKCRQPDGSAGCLCWLLGWE